MTSSLLKPRASICANILASSSSGSVFTTPNMAIWFKISSPLAKVAEEAPTVLLEPLSPLILSQNASLEGLQGLQFRLISCSGNFRNCSGNFRNCSGYFRIGPVIKTKMLVCSVGTLWTSACWNLCNTCGLCCFCKPQQTGTLPFASARQACLCRRSAPQEMYSKG